MPAASAIAVIGSAALGAASASSQASAAKSAANAQVAATDRATQLQGAIYNDQRALLAPSITAGADARARQMLMEGYTPDEVKAYLASTASAVNSPAPGLATTPAASTAQPRLGSGIINRLLGNPEPNDITAPPAATPTSATPSADYSWVDNYQWAPSSPGYQFRFDEGQRALERSHAASGDYFSGDTGRALVRYGQDYGSNEFQNDWARLGNLAGDGTNATGTTVNVAGNYGQSAASNTLAAGNARASGYQQAGNAWGNFWQGAAGIPMYAQGQGWFGKG